MLAHQGGCFAGRCRGFRQLPGSAGVGQRRDASAVVVGDHFVKTTLSQVRVKEQVLAVEDSPSGHAFFLQCVHQVMGVPGTCHRPNQSVQLAPVLPTAQRVLESGVGGPAVLPQHPANSLPLAVGGHGYGNPTVVPLARIAAVGRHGGVLIAHARSRSSVSREIHQDFRDGGTGGLSLGDVDELTLAGAQPVHQRGHNREDGMFAGGVVGIGYLGHNRVPADIGRLVGEARRAFGGRPGSPKVCPRAVEPIAGGRHHDDVRLNLLEVFVFKAEVLNHPRGEILGKEVGHRDQILEYLKSFGFAEVKGYAKFVAVLFVEVGAFVPELAGDIVLVDRVASVAFEPAGGLQADDLGAHVRQHLHGEGDGDELAHLDDTDAFQGTGHVLTVLH